MLKDRAARAKANVEAVIKAAGLDWTVEVERPDDYKLTLRKGAREFVRKGSDEAVLEDESSSVREHLIEEARRELEG